MQTAHSQDRNGLQTTKPGGAGCSALALSRLLKAKSFREKIWLERCTECIRHLG